MTEVVRRVTGSERSASSWSHKITGEQAWHYHGVESGAVSGSLVLSTFVLKPSLDLPLGHSQSHCKNLAIGR